MATKLTSAQITKLRATANDEKKKSKDRLAAAKQLADHFKGTEFENDWAKKVSDIQAVFDKETKLAKDISDAESDWRKSKLGSQARVDALARLVELTKGTDRESGYQSKLDVAKTQLKSPTQPTQTTQPTQPTGGKPSQTQIAEWRKIYENTQKKFSPKQRLDAAKNLFEVYKDGSGAATWQKNVNKVQKTVWEDTYKDANASVEERQKAAEGLAGVYKGTKYEATWVARSKGEPDPVTTGGGGAGGGGTGGGGTGGGTGGGEDTGGTSITVNLPDNFSEIFEQQKAILETLAGMQAGTAQVVDLPDAVTVLKNMFSQYGMTELSDAIIKYQTDPSFKNIDGSFNQDLIMSDLRNQPAYQTRFAAKLARDAAIQKASQAGQLTMMRPISEADQLTLEQQYADIAAKSGLPAGFYDNPSDFTNLIANDVSVSEYTTRVNMAQQAALTANQNLRQQLKQQFGIEEGALTAYFLDPNRAREVTAQNTNDVVRQFNQAALQAAGVSGGVASEVAQQSTPAAVDVSALMAQAEKLIGLTRETVGGEEAATSEKQLANVLVSGTQGDLGQTDYQALSDVQGALRRKAARYQGGGQIAATSEGVIGLTQANI